MKKGLPVVVLALALWVGGCAQIPVAAIDVNRQVSTGITAMNDNSRELIRAWEETAYVVLDDRWETIYAKADSAFRTKRGIRPDVPLSNTQLAEVAGLAVLVRDEVRKKIRGEADSMREIVASNAKTTLEANESVTNLLISVNANTSMQQSALKQVGALLPIPETVSTFITTTLTAAGL